MGKKEQAERILNRVGSSLKECYQMAKNEDSEGLRFVTQEVYRSYGEEGVKTVNEGLQEHIQGKQESKQYAKAILDTVAVAFAGYAVYRWWTSTLGVANVFGLTTQAAVGLAGVSTIAGTAGTIGAAGLAGTTAIAGTAGTIGAAGLAGTSTIAGVSSVAGATALGTAATIAAPVVAVGAAVYAVGEIFDWWD